MVTQERPLDSVADLAQHLGVSKLTVYRLAAAKKIPSLRLTRRAIRFDRQAVLNALSEQREDVTDAK